MTDWPVTVPSDFERDGYQEVMSNNVLVTNMDAGPPKRRRRFTAGVKKMMGSIIMTDDEIEDLETFYYDTIQESQAFNFPHPRLGTDVSVVFTEPPAMVYFSPNVWRVSIKFEVQP